MRPGTGHPLLRALGLAASSTMLFLVGVVASVLLHLDLPLARRVVARSVSRVLAPTFQGRIEIEHVDRLGLFGLAGGRVRVVAPGGETVLRVDGVRAEVATFVLARSAIFGKGPLRVPIRLVSLADVDACLDRDESGRLLLARAFSPPPSSGEEAGPPGRGVRLTLARVFLAHVHVHGQSPRVDAELEGLRGAFLLEPGRLSADLERVGLRTHGLLPHADLEGDLQAHVRQPSSTGSPLGARASLRGELGAIPVLIDATFEDPRVDAVVDMPAAEPAALRALAPGLTFTEPVRAHAELHGTPGSFGTELDAAAGDGSVEVRGQGSASGEKDLRLSFDASHVDLHALAASAPRSSLDLSGNARLTESSPGTLAGELGARVHEASAPGAALQLEAHGRYDLARKRVDAGARAELEHLVRQRLTVVRAELRASATGSLDAPAVHAELIAHEVGAGPVRFTDVAASTTLDLAGPITARDVSASVSRKGEQASLTVGQARVEGDAVTVDDATLEGLGAPVRARVHASPGLLVVRARAPDVDLGRVGRVTGLEDEITDGHLAFDVDVGLKRDGGDGHVVFDARECQLSKLHDVTAHADAELHGRRVAAHATVRARDVGSFDVSAPSLEIGGNGPLSGSSWRRAWGRVDLASRLDLAKLADLVPEGVLPVSHPRGELVLRGHLARDSASDYTPDFVLSATTVGLALEPRTSRQTSAAGRVLVAPPTWHAYGMDVALDTRVDGTTGFTELSARVDDTGGVLVGVDAKSARVPYGTVFGDPAALGDALRAMPFELRLVVPKRKLKSFPEALGLSALHGELEVNTEVTGPVADPVVNLRASLDHPVRRRDPGTGTPPVVDAALDAHYERSHFSARLRGKECGREALQAELHADGGLDAALAGSRSAPAWSATARAHLDGFPLASIGPLADRQIAGRASGDVTLEGLHEDAAGSADLDLSGLRVGDSEPTTGHVSLRVDGHAAQASLHLEQAGGALDLRADGGSRWGSAITPALDTSRPLDASLSARSFQLAIVQPFLQPLFPELSARVDGRVHASVDPRANAARLDGSLAVSGGRVEIADIGSELHDVKAKISFAPDGTVRVEGLEARGLSGRLLADATAKLEGFQLVSASGHVRVPDGEALPLTVNGVELGTLEGRVDVDASRAASGSELDVRAVVPELHVTMPTTPSRSVQSLGPMADVHVGVRRGSNEFVLVPLGPPEKAPSTPATNAPPTPAATTEPATTTKLSVKLGDDVVVTKGTDLKVALGGAMGVSLGGSTRVTGTLNLRYGDLFVQGRKFEIEKGTVTFVGGDPSNPQVVVTAGWTAPDGTRVYADFVGPLKTGKVTLRSEPPLPKNEVLALIVFGSPDTSGSGNATTGSTPTATSAAGLVGGEAAQPVNHFFQQMGISSVTTKVDTSTANPRPEVEVQVARQISLQIAQVLGTPPLANPDTTLLTVDWRFKRRWSLETTVGNLGSSVVDLIWTHRY